MPNIYTRNGIWWARIKIKGVEYRESLRTHSKPEAQRRLKAVRKDIEDRVYFGALDPVAWQAAVITWNSALPRLDLRPATIQRYITSLIAVREWLDDVPVQRIDGALLKRIIAGRSKRGATNATIRRDLTAISSVLGVAVDEGWVEDNAARAIDRGRVRERREPITLPEPDAIAAVLDVGSRFIDMADFARETGMRAAEIIGLEHARIDRLRMTAQLVETKTGRARAVPLSPRALAIIDRQPRHIAGRHIFWRGAGDPFKNVAAQFYATVNRAAQKAAQQGAPIQRFRFHDLRHLFAVEYLRHARGSIYDLQQILGHASIKTTELYLGHLAPDERRAAMHGTAQIAAQEQRFAPPERA